MYNIHAAYDGQTMYMYSPETDELTLTNPTEEELLETNPFLYARALVDVCNVTERTVTGNPSPVTLITLTPKDGASSRQTGGAASAEKGITKFVLKLRIDDLMPLSVELKEGKKLTTLTLKDPRFITSKQEYKITPDKNTFVNDMRL
jgi:outer membrane lipoprotein-sorting protein